MRPLPAPPGFAMKVERVVALLKGLEGWRNYVYDDKSPWPRSEVGRDQCRLVGGQYKVNTTGGTATVGYGETSADFIDRYWGKRITQAEALAKMAERVGGFYKGVRGCVSADLSEHQWEAITCRAYQAGAGGFCRSETAQRLNAGDISGALASWRGEFAHPDRSEVEIAHFQTPDKETPSMPTVDQPWMPGVEHVDRGGGTPVQWNGPTVIVLHTTETDNRASYAGTEPHFEIDDDGSILQYVSLNNTAKALYNAPGGVETNRRRGRIIQFELVNRAGRIATISDAQLDGLAECLRFVNTQLPFDVVAPQQGWFGSEAAWDGAPSRFDFDSWEEFGGICGHQHVPENDHWDPGVFPFDRLASRLDAPVEPNPEPEPDLEVPDLFIFDYKVGEDHRGILYSDGFYCWGVTGQTLSFYNTGKVPHLGAKGPEFLADLTFREKRQSAPTVAQEAASAADLVDVDGCVTLYGPVEALAGARGDGS